MHFCFTVIDYILIQMSIIYGRNINLITYKKLASIIQSIIRIMVTTNHKSFYILCCQLT